VSLGKTTWHKLPSVSWSRSIYSSAPDSSCFSSLPPPLVATQPLDSALLKDTIGTQDAAFQISSVNSVKRIVKTPQLASQVDTRVRRVVRSGDDKAAMLEQQRTKREARIKMRGGGMCIAIPLHIDCPLTTFQPTDIANLTDLSNDIQSAEGELARDAILSQDLSNKAERAATVSSDIESIRASSKT
jgi:hypothetical protein